MTDTLPHADYKTPYYQVVKQHSGVTDQLDLLRVMSRISRTIEGAEDWMSFEQSQDPDGEYFIMTKFDPKMVDWIRENESRIYRLQHRRMYKGDDALRKVATVVEKIRYAMDHGIQNNYVLDLLDMFDEESGDFKHE